jgi:hypothetical protein
LKEIEDKMKEKEDQEMIVIADDPKSEHQVLDMTIL